MIHAMLEEQDIRKMKGLVPLLYVSLDVPTRSGVVIDTDNFTLGTIHKMWESAQGFHREVFLGKKRNLRVHLWREITKEL
jgi:hypothetical protein